ncbi:MAG: sodium:calcium antiporter [Acidimicrobiales bacterium]
MEIGLDVVVFVAGAGLSLGTSWVLVTRLERVGERFGLSEALLGLVAALAADTPEITSAVTALVHHDKSVGAGVVIGSNVFNLAALLGLGAVVAGRLRIDRKVIALSGAVALWVAIVCLASVSGVVGTWAGLGLAMGVFVPYVVVLGAHRRGLAWLPLPQRWVKWLTLAIREEELELIGAIRPRRGRPRDALVATVALVVVVGASVTMERAGSALGVHYAVPGIIVGGLILAAATSLPNAVAAVHLAVKGRGSAVMGTTHNSNSLNILAGLLVPALVVGLPRSSGGTILVSDWYLGLTAVTLIGAYLSRGFSRRLGLVIICGYAAFVVSVILVS